MNVETFLNDFTHIANAPFGTECLRRMVYSLGITGDLSEQRSDEGTAIDLLEQIADCREEMIAAKTFKRSPKLESVGDEFAIDLPRIPESWTWTRLVDIGIINPRNTSGDDTLASFVSMSAFSEIHGVSPIPEIRPWGTIKKGFTHFADGDVVVAKITPCFENGKAAVIEALSNGIGAGTTELHVFRPIGDFVLPRYVYLFVRSPYFMMLGQRLMTGTAGQKRLSSEYFATRPFPLPPLREQKRIVNKVDELMKLCDKLEHHQQERNRLFSLLSRASHAHLASHPTPTNLAAIFSEVRLVHVDNMRQTILDLATKGALTHQEESEGSAAEFLSEIESSKSKTVNETNSSTLIPPDVPFTIPKSWAWCRLSQLAELITSGSRGWAKYYSNSGAMFLTMGNLSKDGYQLRLNNIRYVTPPDSSEGRRTRLEAGDILISVTGDVGNLGLIPEDFGEAYINQHTCLLRLHHHCFNLFFAEYLRSDFAKRQFNEPQRGIKNSFRLSDVGEMLVPVPPFGEQVRIVSKLDELMIVIDKLETLQTSASKISEALAIAAVAAITGTKIEEQQEMKVPKMELVTSLIADGKLKKGDKAPLATILAKSKSDVSAKELWQKSGLEIDVFYSQLKIEMNSGWIVEPMKGFMKEVEVI